MALVEKKYFLNRYYILIILFNASLLLLPFLSAFSQNREEFSIIKLGLYSPADLKKANRTVDFSSSYFLSKPYLITQVDSSRINLISNIEIRNGFQIDLENADISSSQKVYKSYLDTISQGNQKREPLPFNQKVSPEQFYIIDDKPVSREAYFRRLQIESRKTKGDIQL